MGRFFWILGILLLLATLGGAWYVNQNGGFHQGAKKERPDDSVPHTIICMGFADLQPGVIKLSPVVPGEVIFIVSEGKVVKKDEVLLRMDATRAKIKVDLAKADLNGALNLETKAKLKPEQHQLQIKQFEGKIEAAKSLQKAAEEELANEKRRAAATKVSFKQYEEKLKAQDEELKVAHIALEELKLYNPQSDVDAAAELVASKRLQLKEAEFGLARCELKAPSDGIVLQVFVNANEVLTHLATTPALVFAPNGPRIVKAEVIQEWASRVEVGQEAIVEDDTFRGPTWKGKGKSISGWYSQKTPIREPFMMLDQRILQCIIELNPDQQSPPLRIGQRVRVSILPNGK